MTPSLEECPTKAKEAPSPHEVRLSLLDTKPVEKYKIEKQKYKMKYKIYKGQQRNIKT